MISGTPLVFPSLGPTAFMLFHEPRQPAARPLTTICGHAIGILCGFGALWLTGLADDPPTMVEHVNLPRVICAALALGTTGIAMLLLGVWHPPAGATTLIVSLGFITRPYHLVVVELAVVALVVMAGGINRWLVCGQRRATAARSDGEFFVDVAEGVTRRATRPRLRASLCLVELGGAARLNAGD